MPIAPTWMLMRSDCAKTASPLATSDDPVRALPSTIRSQVSCFASRHHSEFGARSIRSNMKCAFEKPGWYDPKSGRSGVRHRNCVLDMEFALSAMIE